MKEMIRLFFALCLAVLVFNLQATSQDEEFQKIAGDWVEGFLSAHPEYATELELPLF